jgi:PleD family two-component response regulator
MSYGYNLTRKNKLNILVVDDDETSLELFKDILQFRGHNVTAVNEGVRCISHLQNNYYDIIFLDYHIGDIDGVDLADCIKDVFKHKSLIFAYTGDSSTNALDRFKIIGMNGALIKPLNIDLIDSIMNTIEKNEKNNKNIENKLKVINDESIIIF